MAISQWARQESSRFWRAFVFTLAPNATDVASILPQIPDRWIVSVMPAAGVRVNVFLGPSPAGEFIPLGGGGKCIIPSDLDSLAFRSAGSNPVTFVAVAVRNYDGMDIDCGELV